MRLTSDEIRTATARLSEWQSPTEMLAATERLMDQLGCEDLFNRSGPQFLLEAWIAGTFGEMRKATSVRHVSDLRPDIELRFENGDIQAFELVEADICSRRRGDEYKALAAAGNPTYCQPAEEWATAEQALEVIRAAAGRKAQKARKLAAKGTPYPPGTALLIYLNIQDNGAHSKEIEAVFDAAVQPATNLFSSIWILWKTRAFHVC